MTVSIAMCTHNGGIFLKEQLNSFLNQDVLPDSIVVYDDKSTDNTLAILKDFQMIAPFSVNIKQNKEKIGTRENFQQAIDQANADIIFLADQDDIWKKNKISNYIKCFQSDPDALLFFSDGNLIDENGDELGSTLWEKWSFDQQTRTLWQDNFYAFKELLVNNNKATGATVAFRSTLKEKALPFYTRIPHWHDAWLALVAAGMHGLRFIQQPLIKYRIHSNQQVGIGGGFCLNPFHAEMDSLTEIQTRLIQLNFQKYLSNLFPENKYVDSVLIEEEILFLEKKARYSATHLTRFKNFMALKQKSLNQKFARNSLLAILKDLLYSKQ